MNFFCMFLAFALNFSFSGNGLEDSAEADRAVAEKMIQTDRRAELTSPAAPDVSKKPEVPKETASQRAERLRAAFLNDPLDFAATQEDRIRFAKFVLSFDDPVYYAKKLALAAWYSDQSGDRLWKAYEYLPQTIEYFEGKSMSVEEAYKKIARRLRYPDRSEFLLFWDDHAEILLISFLSVVASIVLVIIFLNVKSFVSARLVQFSESQKIFIGLAVVACIMLVIACLTKDHYRFGVGRRPGLPAGFYVVLRIIVSAAFVGLIREKFGTFFRFVLLLALVLYNPVIQIHLGGAEKWIPFNLTALPLLVVPWIVLLRRKRKEGTDGAAQTR